MLGLGTEPPQITIGVQQQAGLYGVAGFEDFNRWMLMNDATYRAASDHAESLGMTNEDRLRYLVSAMAIAAYGYREVAVDQLRTARNVPPVMFSTERDDI